MEYLNKKGSKIYGPSELKEYLSWADFSLEAKEEF